MGNIIINIQEKNASEGARNTVTAYDNEGNVLGRDETNKIILELFNGILLINQFLYM